MEAIRAAEEAALAEAENALEAAALVEGIDDLGLTGVNNDAFVGDDGAVQNQPSNRFIVGQGRNNRAEDEEEDEGPQCKKVFLENLKNMIDIFCIWDCGKFWIKISEILALLVFDAFTELFITICIAVNVLFLALDHYLIDYDGMHPTFEAVLVYGNYFFTALFAIESFAKLGAMSPKYFFKDGWNVFDFIIVVLSLVELLAEGISGLSMLRSFRLLRVFKLAKSWKSLNDILTILSNTIGDLSNLTFVLCIIIFIFAVMGMQLFGSSYIEHVCAKWKCQIPRWHFLDFMHSFMIVFRVLCGEWIESMWDCIYVAGPACIPYFFATVLIANLVILNLFLALLLSSFADMGGDKGKEEDDGPDKMAVVGVRIKKFISFLFCRRKKPTDESVVS